MVEFPMQIRVLTYNIWFSDHAMLRRMRAIGDLIALHTPHVVALQEVTEEHWAVLSEHPSLATYDWSLPPADASYYTMLGSLKSWAGLNAERRQYTAGNMGRDLLSAVMRPAGLPPIVIGTTHLESLNSARARSEQIAEATSWLASTSLASSADGPKAEDAILCGDTNVETGSKKGGRVEEKVQLPAKWRDAWEVCGSGPGWTFDAVDNLMVRRLDGWGRVNQARLRYDRFWTRLASYECVGIEIVGTTPLPCVRSEDDPATSEAGSATPEEEQEEWWPSDHYGLLLKLGVAQHNKKKM